MLAGVLDVVKQKLLRSRWGSNDRYGKLRSKEAGTGSVKVS